MVTAVSRVGVTKPSLPLLSLICCLCALIGCVWGAEARYAVPYVFSATRNMAVVCDSVLNLVRMSQIEPLTELIFV